MCGIFGAVSTRAPLSDQAVARAHALQGHRGPDGHGDWRGRVGSRDVSIGSQRLSIIDLTTAGRQPMDWRDGAASIVFNGEIYNYVELREELERAGVRFTTRTDTEVLLAALDHWGLDEAHRRLNGMWAFAWLDRAGARLVLSRDRVGEKPLYIAETPDGIVFASEIKTVLDLSGVRRRVNPRVATSYLLQSLIDSTPETFFEGVRALPAASYGLVDLRAERPALKLRTYWRWESSPAPQPSFNAFCEEIESLFCDAVRIRLRSDVPVGVLLSGGVDSSSIAAAARAIGGQGDATRMLAAVSDDRRYDESPFIDRMASHIGCQVEKVHLDLTPENAVGLLSDASWYHDEPLTSYSVVAHFLLMQRAREHGITVILSGQGGDELLCGYKKYLGFYLEWLVRRGRPLQAAAVLAGFWRNRTIVSQFTLAEARRYLPRWLTPDPPDVRGPALSGIGQESIGLGGGSVEDRQHLDVARLSVPALCHQEDRMSMAHSREIRLPFLDVRLIEKLLSAPVDYKLRSGWTKYVLRRAMERYLPREIAWRKDKQGFVNPQAEWLKYRLRPLVLEHFGADSLVFRLGLLDRTRLLSRYEEYCAQPVDRGRLWYRDIFAPFAMEVWLRRFEAWLA